mgnify:CR=1 FL=1
MRILLAILLFSALGTPHAAAQTPRVFDDLVSRTISFDGGERRFGIYLPSSYSAETAAPLIVVLHGRFSSPKALHALSNLVVLAERRGAILLYPQSRGGFWNDGGFTILRRDRFEQPADDAGFIAHAIDSIAEEYRIDRSRLYLAGFDNGGVMAMSLMCAPNAPWAGAAIVGALMWDYQVSTCQHPRAAPILFIHGRRDDALPVNGAEAPGDLDARRLSAAETLAFWRRANACDDRATASGRDGAAWFANCGTEASSVAYVGAPRGDHVWFRNEEGYELNNTGVDATSLIDAFLFERVTFALPQPRPSGGRGRSYIVYAPPSYEPTAPTPVVVLLHGRPGSSADMAAISQMNAVADRHGFLAVYPQGVDNQWAVQWDLVGQRSVVPQDDVGFLESLMQDLARDFNIDRSRMYIGGFSNGGLMTHRMACSASDTFAAFAPVGAALYVEVAEICRGGRPAPILIINGTADPSIPYTGVEVPNPQGGDPRRVTLSVQETVAFFVRRNGCSFSGQSTTFAEGGRSPGTHVVRFLPRDCPAGSDIAFYIINGGGHTWPGVEGVLDPESLGPTNMDLNASETIWEFFSRHALSESAAR